MQCEGVWSQQVMSSATQGIRGLSHESLCSVALFPQSGDVDACWSRARARARASRNALLIGERCCSGSCACCDAGLCHSDSDS